MELMIDVIKERSGLNEATKEFIWVRTDSDNAEGIFEKETGRLLYSMDLIHGDSPGTAEGILNALGYSLKEVWFKKLLPEVEIEDVNLSNQVPNLKQIQEAIRKMK